MKNDLKLLGEMYVDEVRSINEGIADALKNKVVDWAISSMVVAIKQFAPDVFKQLQGVGSKEELAKMVMQHSQGSAHGRLNARDLEIHQQGEVTPRLNARDYEDFQQEAMNWRDRELMQGGSAGFSPEEHAQIMSRRRAQSAPPAEEPQQQEKVKAAVEKFVEIVKQTGTTLKMVLVAIGFVIGVLGACLAIANPIGIICALFYLRMKKMI